MRLLVMSSVRPSTGTWWVSVVRDGVAADDHELSTGFDQGQEKICKIGRELSHDGS